MRKGKNSIERVLMIAICFLACLALASIMAFILVPLFCPAHFQYSLSDASVIGTVLGCVTFSLTLSVIVPWMASKTHIYSVAESAVKEYYDKDFKRSIEDTHTKIFKSQANDGRMIAYLLCQHDKPVWALGWICKSSWIYSKVEGLSENYRALSASNILVLTDCVLKVSDRLKKHMDFGRILNEDNDEKTDEVAIRTTRDLLKFMAGADIKSYSDKDAFGSHSCKEIPTLLHDTLDLLLRCLIKYLHPRCQNLEDRLNDMSEDDAEYIKIYRKLCQSVAHTDLRFLLDGFITKASKLDTMYGSYVKSRRKKLNNS